MIRTVKYIYIYIALTVVHLHECVGTNVWCIRDSSHLDYCECLNKNNDNDIDIDNRLAERLSAVTNHQSLVKIVKTVQCPMPLSSYLYWDARRRSSIAFQWPNLTLPVLFATRLNPPSIV